MKCERDPFGENPLPEFRTANIALVAARCAALRFFFPLRRVFLVVEAIGALVTIFRFFRFFDLPFFAGVPVDLERDALRPANIRFVAAICFAERFFFAIGPNDSQM